MKKLFYKLLLAGLPLIVITCLYIYADPFMVIWHYDELKNSSHKHLELNEDFVATEDFVRNYDKFKYDTYVFGSSRASFFDGAHLEQLFWSKAYYKYTVALETLYGVERKLEFLDKKGANITNVIIAIDPEILSSTSDSKGHLFKKHPLISGESNFDFQLASYNDIYDLEFISSYYKLFHQKLADEKDMGKDPYALADEKISANSDGYYKGKKKDFFDRGTVQKFANPVIGPTQRKMLRNIGSIFDRHHTNYYLIVNPLYDQVKFCAADVQALDSIFDKKRIFDFAGINEITNSMYNYYEPSHYRRFIAEGLLDSIGKVSKK